MCDGNPAIRSIVGDELKTNLENKRKGNRSMMEKLNYTAPEIAEMVGVGRTKSYGLIKKMNEELERDGYLVIDGKIPKEYFDARYFGGSRNKEVVA